MLKNRVASLLEDLRLLDADRFELIKTLRELILSLDGSISEEVKYGGILFSAESAFCGIFSYTKHVSLEFGAGASLPDQFKVLEGEGKFRRHIKLTSAQDIADKRVREYLVLAMNLAKTS